MKVVVWHGHSLTSILVIIMIDEQLAAIDRIFYKLRKDIETHLLFIALFAYIFQTFMTQHKAFDVNVASLLSKRFSLTQTDIGHYKKENCDTVEEYCVPDAVASLAASGVNAIINATKPLQLSLFGLSGSSAANRFVITFDVTKGNKKLAFDSLRGNIQIPLVKIILNIRNSGDNVNIYNERDVSMISKQKTRV